MNKIGKSFIPLIIVFFCGASRSYSQSSVFNEYDAFNCSIHELRTPFTKIWYTYDTLIQGIRALKVRDEIMTKSEKFFLFNSEKQLISVVSESFSGLKVTLNFDTRGLYERKEEYPDGVLRVVKYGNDQRVTEIIELGKDKIGTRKIYNENNELVQIYLILNDKQLLPK